MRELYVAASEKQTECTLNNAIFPTYADARAYANAVKEHSGCELVVLAMRYFQNAETAKGTL
jgi:hypothetical protein